MLNDVSKLSVGRYIFAQNAGFSVNSIKGESAEKSFDEKIKAVSPGWAKAL